MTDLIKTQSQAAAVYRAVRTPAQGGGVDLVAAGTYGFSGLDEKALRGRTRAEYTATGVGVPLSAELDRLFIV